MNREIIEKIGDGGWWAEQAAHGWMGAGASMTAQIAVQAAGLGSWWPVLAGITAAALLMAGYEMAQNLGDDDNDVLDSVADWLFGTIGGALVTVPAVAMILLASRASADPYEIEYLNPRTVATTTIRVCVGEMCSEVKNVTCAAGAICKVVVELDDRVRVDFGGSAQSNPLPVPRSCPEDVDGDGYVLGTDATAVLDAFGQTCESD